MKVKTTVIFLVLFVVIVALLGFKWLQLQQHHLNMSVYHGAMSQEIKEKYLAKGVDCQETYEMQGYESPETIFRMFSLTQHDFYLLNPGSGMDFPPGMVICVKGLWGVATTEAPMAWFWPVVAVVAAVAGFAAAMMLSSWRHSKQQRADAHVGGSV